MKTQRFDLGLTPRDPGFTEKGMTMPWTVNQSLLRQPDPLPAPGLPSSPAKLGRGAEGRAVEAHDGTARHADVAAQAATWRAREGGIAVKALGGAARAVFQGVIVGSWLMLVAALPGWWTI